MNKKLVIAGTLPAFAAAFTLAPVSASAAIIRLTATGTTGAGSAIYNGSANVDVAVGTSLTATFFIDTDVFPAGEDGGGGTTVYNLAAGGGCLSVQLPQVPLLASMMSGTVTVGGVTLQSQAAGNQRGCDFVSMNSTTGAGAALSVQQDAYDTQIVYYVDGDLTTVSPTPTLYHISETRIQNLTLRGFFDNNPFSMNEVLSELVQTFTLNSFYGTSISTEFGRGFYTCSDPGGAGYRCVNVPQGDGDRYGINGIITGVEGILVPVPATLGLFGTALASLGLAVRRRLRRRA